jgi:hypothetical protein
MVVTHTQQGTFHFEHLEGSHSTAVLGVSPANCFPHELAGVNITKMAPDTDPKGREEQAKFERHMNMSQATTAAWKSLSCISFFWLMIFPFEAERGLVDGNDEGCEEEDRRTGGVSLSADNDYRPFVRLLVCSRQ